MPRLIQGASTWCGKGPVACLECWWWGHWGPAGALLGEPGSHHLLSLSAASRGWAVIRAFIHSGIWVFVAAGSTPSVASRVCVSGSHRNAAICERVLDRFSPWAGHRQRSEVLLGSLPGRCLCWSWSFSPRSTYLGPYRRGCTSSRQQVHIGFATLPLPISCACLPDRILHTHLEPQCWELLPRGHLEMVASGTRTINPMLC